MRIVELRGGIGNQMFDYAFAVALSQRTGRKVHLGLRETTDSGAHNGFELERVFGIKFGKIDRLLTYLIQYRKFKKHFVKLCIEKAYYEYDPTVFAFRSSQPIKHFMGYWQNEEYFASVKDIIRHNFSFDQRRFSRRTNEVADQLATLDNSVSLHIRRGDYYSNPEAYALHGDICSTEYYRAAIDLVQSKVADAKFYIFSDEPEWVKENFKMLSSATYIDWNLGLDAWQDMALMSRCAHHIIANSSFSWWGAWLAAPQPDKIIIAPSQWLRATTSNAVVPPNWTMI